MNSQDRWCLLVHGDPTAAVALSRLIVRAGATAVLVATAGEAAATATRATPSLAVIELELQDQSGYEVCRQLRDQFGQTLPIAMISRTRREAHDEVAALLVGADDYFVTPIEEERVLARLRRMVARGLREDDRSGLTPREREVLTLLVDGQRPADIAEQLVITRKTAATHVDHILVKLGAHSQAQAVAFAVRDKLLEVG